MTSTGESVTQLTLIKDSLALEKARIMWIERRTTTIERYGEEFDVMAYHVHVRPHVRYQCLCPECMKRCVRDGFKKEDESSWRAPDLNGVPVIIKYRPQRIKCEKHGEINEWIPWADGESRFTKEFNDEVAWLACRMDKTSIATFLGINWRTVGNCIKAAHSRIEPDVSDRIHSGLREICVDETSYSVGHKYITVVYDMERDRVVWVHKDHGKHVFEEFCLELTEEERENIDVVAGDGARWIDDCTAEYFPEAKRCVDFFHVCGWANDALDKVRISAANRAKRVYDSLSAQFAKMELDARLAVDEALRSRDEAQAELDAMPRRGRPSKRKLELRAYIEELDRTIDEGAELVAAQEAAKPRRKARKGKDGKEKPVVLLPEHLAVLKEVEESRKAVKGAKHALGHSPENRTENQTKMIELIEVEQPDLFLAYQLKERLRLILHLKDAEEAAAQLDEWMEDAKASGLKAMADLAEKVGRHRQNILNAVELQANSAKSESCNTTIKALIKMARGFRNLDNMFALIYLKCSDLVVPLRNRPQPSGEWQKEARDKANQRRREKEEKARLSFAVA